MEVTGEKTALSRQYETSLGLPHATFQALKERITQHYDMASDYYLSLWGEHIHHGYWPTAKSETEDSKEQAQLNLIKLLLEISKLGESNAILDVGCGIGGTARYLASALGCTVTGITISSKQVEIAQRLTKQEAEKQAVAGRDIEPDAEGFTRLGSGKVRFVEMDAEKMMERFNDERFDGVWVSEALSHFPDKPLFFRNAHAVLNEGGKLVIADWFKAENLDEKTFVDDIKPIEDGMLLPPLCTDKQYTQFALEGGLRQYGEVKDISQDVKKTWDISWKLVQNPSLWAYAFTQGRDGIAFLQSFRAMRRGYAGGGFRYAVMVFEK